MLNYFINMYNAKIPAVLHHVHHVSGSLRLSTYTVYKYYNGVIQATSKMKEISLITLYWK